MNIQFQICGLCILILLIIFYKSHMTLQLYKEKVFYAVLCIITISLTGDILSLVAIQYGHILPSLLVNFICKTYIITLIWGAWSALIYVITDLVSEKKHRKITCQSIVLTSIQSMIIYILPIHIFREGNQMYTYGAAVLGVYCFVALYIIATLTISFVFRKRLNPRRGFAIILWMLIWMSSAILQFLNSALLIVGFASALGVLILFVLMENPEANLERQLGCFNSYALTEYLKQLYERKIDFAVLEISFDNTFLLEEQRIDSNDMLRKILHLLERDIFVFKNINLSLVLISETADKLETAAKALLDSYLNTDLFQKTATLVLTSQTASFSDMDDLFHFLSFVRTLNKDKHEKLIYANEVMISKYQEQSLIEQEITNALLEDRVDVYLQPIYSNLKKSFSSAEALVRIRRTDGTLLPPGQFIAIAEDNGQIVELGERVFEKVCYYLKHTDIVQLGIRYIEVNLSVIQCEDPNLSKKLISIIEKYNVDPGLINLEITETASINARQTILENMHNLIDFGFTFSLDDFGKGESNLMYIVDMPVSIVKLDYDMSKAFFTSSKAKQVVRAVISMVHGMGLNLVAEGIETRSEAEAITREGIDYIQGFYYSRPLPIQDFLKFLQAHR